MRDVMSVLGVALAVPIVLRVVVVQLRVNEEDEVLVVRGK